MGKPIASNRATFPYFSVFPYGTAVVFVSVLYIYINLYYSCWLRVSSGHWAALPVPGLSDAKSVGTHITYGSTRSPTSRTRKASQSRHDRWYNWSAGSYPAVVNGQAESAGQVTSRYHRECHFGSTESDNRTPTLTDRYEHNGCNDTPELHHTITNSGNYPVSLSSFSSTSDLVTEGSL